MRHSRYSSLALALVAGLAAPTLGQPAPGKQNPPVRTGGMNPVPMGQPVFDEADLITVDFPGGDVGKYVQAVKAACAKPLNVVLDEDGAKVPMPAVRLQSVSPMTALRALTMSFRTDREHQFAVDTLGGTGAESWTAFISYQGRGSPFAAGAAPQAVEVLSIRDLIAPPPGVDPSTAVKLPDLLTVLEEAMATASKAHDGGAGAPPDVRVHEATSIIIVRAPRNDIEVARETIQRIREDQARKVQSVRDQSLMEDAVRAERDESQAMVSELGMLLRQAETRLAGVKSNADQVKIRVDSSLASKAEFDSAQQQVREAQAAVDVAQSRLRMATDRNSNEAMLSRARLRLASTVGAADRDLSAARDQIAALQAEVAALREELTKARNQSGR